MTQDHSLARSSSDEVRVRVGSTPLRIEASDLRVDVVFVIDTTGSMAPYIDGLITRCQAFVDALALRRLDWQIAIVAFGDLTVPGDSIQATSFSKHVGVVKRALENAPRNSGGVNEGESSFDAVMRAIDQPGYRPDSVRVLLLLTDEPPLTENYSQQQVLAALKEREFLAFAISTPGYRSLAEATGGEWFTIANNTNFLSVLDRFSRKVSDIVSEIHRLGGGSTADYLRLRSGG